MDAEANKALVRRYIDMWNTGQTSIADAVLAPGWADHAHPEVDSIAAVKQSVERLRGAVPDFQITIEQLICEGDLVALRGAIRQTRQDQQQIAHVLWLVRIAGGRMAEMWTGIEAAR